MYKGGKFPKCRDPEGELKKKALPVRVVQKAGSLMSKDELEVGHRHVKDAIVKSWLKDIENGDFLIEQIPDSEMNDLTSRQQRPQKPKDKNKLSKQNRSEDDDDDACSNPATVSTPTVSSQHERWKITKL